MIDHVVINTTNYAKSKAFYLAALKPLGYDLVAEFDRGETKAFGVGPDGKPNLWVRQTGVVEPVHIAITSPDRPTVDAFYKAALAVGGKDNGAPGVREHYHPNYYGAFVHDPDGNNIEAVNHGT